VSVGGETVLVHRDFTPRPEVAVLFPYEPVEVCGWRLTAEIPPGAMEADAILALDVVDAEGGVSRLYEDRLAAALLRSARLDLYFLGLEVSQRDAALAAERARHEQAEAGLRGEIAGFQNRLAAMEASRFWKLRNLWWKMKGR
jgi:hypothetical protein